MESPTKFSTEVNLLNCDKEPIHIPGRIQSYGFLLVCEVNSLNINQLSINSLEYIGISYQNLLNKNLSVLLEIKIIDCINKGVLKNNFSEINPLKVNIKNTKFNLIISFANNLLILEFEPFIEDDNLYAHFYHSFNSALTKIQSSRSLKNLFQTTAEEVRKLIGYDRVMIYRFDKDWHGEVVGESKIDSLEPFLGLHYPHTDIPSQARDLYLKNWTRLITDVEHIQPEISPVINPQSGKPIDLSCNVLRATSPIHIEYLVNMGVRATLTISIIFKGKLWGLFACHHYSPRYIDYYKRNTCELIGKIFSNHLSYQEADQDLQYSNKIKDNTRIIIENMSKNWSVSQGLINGDLTLMDINDSNGAVYFNNDDIYSLRDVPTDSEIKSIIDFLNEKKEKIFYTNELSLIFPTAKSFKEKASGILAINISDNEYVIWFKPELIQNVQWAGKPDEKNIVYEKETIRLSPRKSFEKWTQEVQNKSTDWQKVEIEAAENLREKIIAFVIKKSLEIKKLNQELELQKLALISKNEELMNFAYVASHDLKEPLRMITSYNQLLLKKYKNQLDEDAEEFLNFSIDGARRMKLLIDSLLQYAKIGYEGKTFSQVNINSILQSCLSNLKLMIKEKETQITVEDMPIIYGDSSLILILFQNLVSNAIKYSNTKNSQIDINYYSEDLFYKFSIKDNGIGIERKNFSNIFLMFKRLHSKSEFEGSGIGLATCKKIIDNHRGEIWLESEIGKGSIFYFTISKNLINRE